jgi:hypothetical protein
MIFFTSLLFTISDVLTSFRGAGVPDSTAAMLRMRVATDRGSISKYEITRNVLRVINDDGDQTLAQRREVIKRVTEFHDFSACWETDRLTAQGLVSRVRELVNAWDMFTRIVHERDAERRERLRQQEAEAFAKQLGRALRGGHRKNLAALSAMTDPRERGLAFESLLNAIFMLDGLSVREAFTLNTEEGIVGEQIDGLIVLDGQPILVEAKWQGARLGVNEVSRHLVRVYSRPAGVHGLIVSASAFTTPAVEECKRALSQRVIMLAEVNELLLLEDPDASVGRWLCAKRLPASVDREPLFRP